MRQKRLLRTAALLTLFTEGAEQDLESIYDYIAECDCVANANRVLDQLLKTVDSLARFPERGSYPKELLAGAAVGWVGGLHWIERVRTEFAHIWLPRAWCGLQVFPQTDIQV